MKPILWFVLLFSTLPLARLHAVSADAINVERYVYLDEIYYQTEEGLLTEEGYIPRKISRPKAYTWSGPKVSEVAKISGWPMVRKADWEMLAGLGAWKNTARSINTFKVGGISFYIVSYSADAKGNQTASNPYNLEIFTGKAYVTPARGVELGFKLRARTKVMIRVWGPAFKSKDVPDVLADPKFTVYAGSKSKGSNDNWCSSTSNRDAVKKAVSRVGTKAFADKSKDAALITTLDGGKYTVKITGPAKKEGYVFFEVLEVPEF